MKFRDSRQYYIVKSELEKNLSARADRFAEASSEVLSRYFQQGVDVYLDIEKVFVEYVHMKNQSPKRVLIFFLSTWYIKDEVLRTLTQMACREKVNMFGPEYYIKLSTLLESKAQALELILEGTTLGRNPNELFGVLGERDLHVKLREVPNRKPKRTQRHRGYRDKGTLLEPDKRIRKFEQKRDSFLTEEQNKIEENRQIQEDALEFIKGFLMP